MPRFAANLSLLWTETDFPARFARAAAAGFAAVEYQFPYDYEPERLADLLAANGLALAMHNLPAGDWAAGERGIACIPGRESEFEDGVGRALAYARAQGTRKLNCLAGRVPDGAEAKARDTLLRNLSFAAAALKAEGMDLLVEAVNSRDMPGFMLNRSRQVLDLPDEVGADNIFLQYDLYHMQIMEGDLTTTLTHHMPRIGHIQIADVPDRGEPGTGEIGFPFVLAAIDAAGYAGWIGCEYRPRTTTDAGLGWFAPYRPDAGERIAPDVAEGPRGA